MEVLFGEFIDMLPTFDTKFIATVLTLLEEGIKHSDTQVINCASRSIDLVASHVAYKLTKEASCSSDPFVQSFQNHPHQWQRLTEAHFQALLDDDECQWTLSRSLLPLIILCDDHFKSYLSHLIAQQPEPCQARYDTVLLLTFNRVCSLRRLWLSCWMGSSRNSTPKIAIVSLRMFPPLNATSVRPTYYKTPSNLTPKHQACQKAIRVPRCLDNSAFTIPYCATINKNFTWRRIWKWACQAFPKYSWNQLPSNH